MCRIHDIPTHVILQCNFPYIGTRGKEGGRDCGGVLGGARTGDRIGGRKDGGGGKCDGDVDDHYLPPISIKLLVIAVALAVVSNIIGIGIGKSECQLCTVVWEIFGVGIFSYTEKYTKIKRSKYFLQRIIKERKVYSPKIKRVLLAAGEIESDEERSDVDFKLFETPKWSFRPQRPIFSAPTFASDGPC